ncbi:hypothetical protein Fleli_2449 [Bernardetia litoralis DSM 6794]|uniref:DUF4290 domain-containing protein n=1 Tax=Bernardetia litoralis (strain ATCC 23117 / DSM 6794 / NBRC 15988 / NCIMB 1366 / Fx l1 / Sio-4) TaxID=880071 RepID=I4ALI0_BERLS|nr:DUF4290 domain-containing protein [Bernardetia litoralis]AFM04815.1 hypothetical protein Fleli_2449 [Bernardetia litoralis DSM 6794]
MEQIENSDGTQSSVKLKNLDYNTQRDALVLKEYGRNMQNMVRHLKTITDVEERTRAAETLINLMKQLNPSVRENSDNVHRIWDHLYIMADGEIEFNNEFLPQTEEERTKKPDHIGYTQEPVKYRHYGRNVELVIAKAAELEDEQELIDAVADIGKLMKSFYLTWNRDSVEDEVILKDIKRISGGKIDINIETIKEDNLFELGSTPRQRPQKQSSTNRSNSSRSSRSNNASNRRRTQGTGIKKNRRNSKKRRK